MSALNATYPSANTTVSTGGVAALYHQCGGINWTGATKCETGSYCKVQNDFYFQCVANEGAYTNATATGSNGKLTRMHLLKRLRLFFPRILFQCLTYMPPKSRLHQHTPRLRPGFSPAHDTRHNHRLLVRRCHTHRHG